MKRITTLVLALALSMSLVACGSNKDDSSSAPAPTPEATAIPEATATPDATPDADTDADASTGAEVNAYANIIADTRDAEMNEYYMVVSSVTDGDGYAAIHGYSADYEPEFLKEDANNMMLPMLGIDPALTEDFAFSMSAMMTQCYGVAIVKPTEGNTDAVKAGLEAYVTQQRSAFEPYLPDQYEIAKAATVTVAESGEVILVCGPDSDAVLAAIEAAL